MTFKNHSSPACSTAIHRSWVSLPLSSSLPATDSKMNGIFLFDIFQFLMARSKDFLPPGWDFAFKWVFSVAEKLWLLFPVRSPAPSKSCTWKPEPQPVGTPLGFPSSSFLLICHSMSAASSKVLEVIVRCFILFL